MTEPPVPQAPVPGYAGSQPSLQPTPKRKSRSGFWLLLFGFFFLGAWVVAVMVFWLFMRSMSPTPVKISDGTILELNLSGSYTEGPPAVDFGFFGSVEHRSFWGLRRALQAAAEDDDIAGIFLSAHGAATGWAGAEEINGYLEQFKASGKPIYALLPSDLVSDLDYFLAASADRVWATPQTAGAINGLVAEAQFLRGSLEKLHIEPQVIMYKEYKSAGESYGNYEMSPYMREALDAVLRSTTSSFNSHVVEHRGLTQEQLDSFLARGMTTAPQLLEHGLVDELGYRDHVEAAFAALEGVDSYRGVSTASYLDSLPDERPSGGQRIAVIFGEGAIIAQAAAPAFPFFGAVAFSGPVVANHIRRAAEDSRVDAIIFRVNSPGGSPVGSDVVRREIQRARAGGTPVIVSMANVAGSGGYWVAMDADAIVAHSTTITGSIGVVFQKLNLDGFYEWLGAHVDQVATAPRANILGFGPWGPGEREAVEKWMDEVYRSFTEGVAAGREMEVDRVLEIAKGRIWSGEDALERSLIDRVGGFEDALELAKEAAGLDLERDYPLVVYPRPKPFFQRLLNDDWVRTAVALTNGTGRLAAIDWLERQSEPRVLAQMPNIRVH